MEKQIDSWCIMCGAAPGQPCITIDGGYDGLVKGQERPTMHFYRGGLYEQPSVLIPNEPAWNDPQIGVTI